MSSSLERRIDTGQFEHHRILNVQSDQRIQRRVRKQNLQLSKKLINPPLNANLSAKIQLLDLFRIAALEEWCREATKLTMKVSRIHEGVHKMFAKHHIYQQIR
jgi:hypothetical protein